MTPFLPAAAERGDVDGLIAPPIALTWTEVEDRARRAAHGLAARVEEGERIAVLLGNCAEYVIVHMGAMQTGVTLVPVNWHLGVDEVAWILADSEARLVVTDEERREVAQVSAQRAGDIPVLVAGAEFDAWLANQDDGPPPDRRAGGLLLYTSGTTGRPKGVLKEQPSIRPADVWAGVGFISGFFGYEPGGVHLVAGPLYHGGPLAHAMYALAAGQTLLLMDRFDPATALDWIERYRVTSTHMGPTMFVRLLRLPEQERAKTDVSSMRLAVHGAAPCPAWVKRAMIDWWGPIVVEYYGSSEGGGPTRVTSEEWLAHPGTVGKPLPSITVSVIGEDGAELGPGEVGTLYFRSLLGPPQYLNDPVKTAAADLGDGRFTAGDIGYLDNEGYLYITDRRIDMIISGGVNIYPAEVEAALSQHAAVADCAVFGVPDDEWGEQVKAAVELEAAATVDAEELLAWCRDRLAHYKCPRSVDFHDRLPRSENGKLDKRSLRDPYWAGTGRSL